MDSSVDWYLVCFQFITITRNAAIHIPVYVSLCTLAGILLEVDLMSGKVFTFLHLPEIESLSSKGVETGYIPNTIYKNI